MVTCLVLSARLNGRDPWAYLRDVLQRLACLNFVE
ncbi:transposase domain-containing protein [Curvibacter gracilis]|nr:transposase domain-containing protein [Curvibacter gracilis]